MGKVMSYISKPIRNYNIESRAHKAISKDKPTVHPKYKTDAKEYERLVTEYPTVLEQSQKKNEQHDQRLRDIFVTSHDSNPTLKIQNPDKPLPLDRAAVPDYEFGYKEPDAKRIGRGKITLKQALEFITNHQNDPKKCSKQLISDTYLLPEETVDDIIRHFKVYEIYIPTKRNNDVLFAGPSQSRLKVFKNQKLIPTSNKGSDEKT